MKTGVYRILEEMTLKKPCCVSTPGASRRAATDGILKVIVSFLCAVKSSLLSLAYAGMSLVTKKDINNKKLKRDFPAEP